MVSSFLNFRSNDGSYQVPLNSPKQRYENSVSELVEQLSNACIWRNISISTESQGVVTGSNILGTFRSYVDQKDLRKTFRMKINGTDELPIGITTKNSNLRPLIKWIIHKLNPDQRIEDRMMNYYVEKLYEELPELDYFQEPEILTLPQGSADGVGFMAKIKKRIHSHDLVPQGALISPDEIQIPLGMSGGSLNSLSSLNSLKKKAIKTHLQDIPGIDVLSALSFSSYNEADKKIKEIFPKLQPINKGTYQLKLDPTGTRPTKFSVYLSEKGFEASQSRIYELQKRSKKGGENPLTTLATLRVNYTLNARDPKKSTCNLSLSKIKFVEGLDEKKIRAVIDIFSSSILKQYRNLGMVIGKIAEISTRKEKIDTTAFMEFDGSKLIRSMLWFGHATFNVSKEIDEVESELTLKYSASKEQSFYQWFYKNVLQVKEPLEKATALYNWNLNNAFSKEERYYGEQLLRVDLKPKILKAMGGFFITGFNTGYYEALKNIVNDEKRTIDFIKAVKSCKSKDEIGKLVTKTVLKENPKILSHLIPHLDKFIIMAFADSSNFDLPLKKEIGTFTLQSKDFYIEKDEKSEEINNIYYDTETGQFEIEKKITYTIKNRNDSSEVLAFTVESAISGQDWEYINCHKISNIEICDTAYPPAALSALNQLRATLEQ